MCLLNFIWCELWQGSTQWKLKYIKDVLLLRSFRKFFVPWCKVPWQYKRIRKPCKSAHIALRAPWKKNLWQGESLISACAPMWLYSIYIYIIKDAAFECAYVLLCVYMCIKEHPQSAQKRALCTQIAFVCLYTLEARPLKPLGDTQHPIPIRPKILLCVPDEVVAERSCAAAPYAQRRHGATPKIIVSYDNATEAQLKDGFEISVRLL